MSARVEYPRCHQPTCERAAVVTVADRFGRWYACCSYHAVLKRAGWRCEVIIEDRLHPGQFRRCPVVGSEIGVVGDEARCPHHRESV